MHTCCMYWSVNLLNTACTSYTYITSKHTHKKNHDHKNTLVSKVLDLVPKYAEVKSVRVCGRSSVGNCMD